MDPIVVSPFDPLFGSSPIFNKRTTWCRNTLRKISGEIDEEIWPYPAVLIEVQIHALLKMHPWFTVPHFLHKTETGEKERDKEYGRRALCYPPLSLMPGDYGHLPKSIVSSSSSITHVIFLKLYRPNGGLIYWLRLSNKRESQKNAKKRGNLKGWESQKGRRHKYRLKKKGGSHTKKGGSHKKFEKVIFVWRIDRDVVISPCHIKSIRIDLSC